MKKVLVFGVFDKLHEGHKYLLTQAKGLGDYLVVVIAPDKVVEELKDRIPVNNSAKRIQNLKNQRVADEVVLGDGEAGSWKVLKKHKPEVIALGFDQEDLKSSLEEYFENSEKKPTILTLDKKYD